MRNFPNKCDILFCSYGGGHVAALLPVAQSLTELGHNVCYLALTTAQSQLDRTSTPYFGYKEIAERRGINIDPRYEYLIPKNNSPLVSDEETRAYTSMNIDDLVAKHGYDEALSKYNAMGRQAFFPLQSMRRLLRELEPKVVVGTNSPRSERAIIQAAQELDIPRLCLVDLFALQEIQWIKEPGFANRICVLNEAVRDNFIRSGCDVEKVKVTGNPAFDSINSTKTIQLAKSWRRKRGIPEDGKVILWASQEEPAIHPFSNKPGDPQLPILVENYLRDALSTQEDWHLLIRPHPSENRIVQEGSRIHISSHREPLHPILHAADAVVVLTSTVGLEASISGTPVVSVDLSIFTPDAPYSEYGISHGIRDLSLLETTIVQALESGKKSKKNQEICSTHKVRDQILSIIK